MNKRKRLPSDRADLYNPDRLGIDYHLSDPVGDHEFL